eukprot:scaffold22233_cov55-Phaeocystis_antarctica.AAC.4
MARTSGEQQPEGPADTACSRAARDGDIAGCGDGQSRFEEQPELARPTNRRHGVLPAARSPRAENSVRTAQAAAMTMRTRVRKLREDLFA